MTSNLIDSPSLRNAWIMRLHAMIATCQQCETQISIAMLAYPGTANALALISADGFLHIDATLDGILGWADKLGCSRRRIAFRYY